MTTSWLVGAALSLMLAAPAEAGLSPFKRLRDDGSQPWVPARETDAAVLHKYRSNAHRQVVEAEDGGDLATVAAPTPTRPPDLMAMELVKRYSMGSDTCGFAAEYKSAAWTCNKVAASCQSVGTNIGCCSGTSPACSATIISTCVEYTKDVTRSCGTGQLCCISASPSCFTWKFSSSTATDKVYSAFNCYSAGGTGTLMDQPPQNTQSAAGSSDKPDSSTPDLNPSTTPSSSTRSSSSSTGSARSSTSTPAEASTDGGGGSSNNTGAIVGGVVGGVAVIALAGVAIFWMVVRNRRKKAASTAPGSSVVPSMPSSPPPPMGQHNSYYNYGPGQSPPAQGQDPGYLASMHQFMSAEQKPPEQGGGVAPYPAQPQQQHAPGAMPQAQQGAWAGNTPPQQYGQGLHPPPASHRQSNSPTVYSELGAVNPMGTQGNRAELGSGMGHR